MFFHLLLFSGNQSKNSGTNPLLTLINVFGCQNMRSFFFLLPYFRKVDLGSRGYLKSLKVKFFSCLTIFFDWLKKQNSKKDSELPLNHYSTVYFRCYFNLVFTTHEAGLLCCVQMKAQILEPVNWLWGNWPVAEEIKIWTGIFIL